MNISSDNISSQITNRFPVAQTITGEGRESANVTATVTAAASAPIILSGAENNGISENPTYQRPINQPPASLNPTEQTQANDTPSASSQARATEDADNNRQQEKSNESHRAAATQEQYSDVELKQIRSLKMRDSEVLAHERAHSAVGGQYAGSPTYSYQSGPDGVKYAVGGEVSIDTSKVANDPQATLQKAQQIKAAALAPAAPSAQDRRVAAKADQMAAQARNDLLQGQENSVSKGSVASGSDEASVSDHFTGVEYLEKENNLQQSLNNRMQQISSLYQNSSASRTSPTFQIQI